MMQTAQNGDLDDLPKSAGDLVADLGISCNGCRSALCQTLMRTKIHKVSDALSKNPPQVVLAENKDVVEAYWSLGSSVQCSAQQVI